MTDHFREAERLIKQADTWENADQGWRAGMSAKERVDRAKADYLGAIAHGIAGVLEALQTAPIDLIETSARVPLLNIPMRADRKKATP